MKRKESKTDFVQKMRDIRDKFSREIMDMDFEEERDYIRKQLAELKKTKVSRIPQHENIRGAEYYK